MSSRAIIFSIVALLGTIGLLWKGYTGLGISHEDEHEHAEYFRRTASEAYSGQDVQHDQARYLAQHGDILPLEKILESAYHSHQGRVIETELYRRGDRYVYEVELLDERGEVLEMILDATTGDLIEKERED